MRKHRTPYNSIIVIILACVILFLVYTNHLFLVVGLLAGLLSLLFPKVAFWIDKVWFALARVLGWVSSRILFSVVFVVFLIPLSFLFKNKITIDIKRKDGSLFRERNHLYTANDLENMW